MTTFAKWCFAAVAAATLAAGTAAYAQQRKPATEERPNATKAAARSRNEQPVADLEELQIVVKFVTSGDWSLRANIARLQKYGLGFTLSPADRQALGATGAPRALLNAIDAAVQKRAATAAATEETARSTSATTPVITPARREGDLTITCEPVACTVDIDGSSAQTPGSRKVFEVNLPAGEYRVTASSPGYDAEPRVRRIRIGENSAKSIAFQLQPTPGTRWQAGMKLRRAMITALGGDEGVRDLQNVRAVGTAILQDKDGTQSTLSLTMFYRAPNSTKCKLVRGGATSEFVQTSTGETHWAHPPTDAANIEDHLRRLLEYQPATLLARWTNGQPTLSASPEVPGSTDPRSLRVEAGSDIYLVKLDADLRPVNVRLESSGLENGVEIIYSDYQRQGKSWYPRRIQVLLPGAPRWGSDVRFAQVVLGPTAVSDRDLAPPKGGIPGLRKR